MKKVIHQWTKIAAGAMIALTGLCGNVQTARAQSPSWLNNAVIYCVQPEIFSLNGIKGVTAQLSRLHNLGVNVIWLMPIYPRGNPITIGSNSYSSFNSPYDIQNFEGIDPAEGTSTDLTNLVSTAHSLGMKVILDVALNCTSWDNPLVQSNPQYYIHTDGNVNNVASIQDGWGTETDVAQLNLTTDTYGAQTYVTNVCKYWVTNYSIDGFRFDSADNPQGTTRSFPQSLGQSIQSAIGTNELMLGEEEDVALALAPYGLDYGWNMWYYGVDSAFGQNGGAYTLQYQWQYPYTSSNTSPAGMLHMNIQDDWDLTNRDVVTLGGYSQAMAAAVFDCTTSGVPLIYNGMEVANNNGGNNPHTQINWNGSNAYAFQTFYQQLLTLRNNSAGALQQGTTTWVTNSSNNAISTYDRSGGGQEYLIEINTTANSFSGTVSPPAGGAWIEVTPPGAPGGQNHVNPGTGNLSLQGWDFAIFQRSTSAQPAATPSFSLTPGTYTGNQSLTISDATSGATIYYTTDGTTPTTSSTKYTGPITLSTVETVKAMAVGAGQSQVRTGVYNIYSGSGGSLSGTESAITTAQNVNLTSQGSSDWAMWGYKASFNYDHSSSGNGQISNLGIYNGGGAGQFTNSLLTTSWTNGTPDTSVSNCGSGYYNGGGVGDGFIFTAPADTTTRTLTVYVGGWQSGGTLTATLSDNSAPAYTNSALVNTSTNYYGVYTLTYKAANANQTLTVTWTQASGSGNVTIQAATLQGNATPTVATPTFSPAPGTYSSTQSVTLSDSTSGASIYYTTDGSTPTTSSTKYTGAITVSSTETFNAMAAASGYNNSAVASGTYTIVTIPSAPTGLSATAGNGQVSLSWTGSSGATSYNLYRSTTSGGEGTTAVVTGITGTSYTNTGLTNGTTYYFKVAAVNSAGTSGQSNEASAKPVAPVEGPYGGTAWAIPGTVQAENYDTGGQGVGYNVTSVNGTANSYRTDGVDLEACSDTGGGYDVGWSASGQWFRYTVNVSTAGTYTVSLRVANGSGSSASMHLQNASGTNLSGAITVPSTGGWQTWTTVTASVTLPAGQQVLTVSQDSANINLNYLTFASQSNGEGPYGGTAASIPGTVQAENYDTGGQGVGYSVGSVNGTANSYRTDGVDLEACSDTGGGYDVGWSASGQWFRYTVNVATAGTYTVALRVANGSGSSASMHLQNASGTNLSGTIKVPNTGGWQTWTTVYASVTLPAGQHVLTVSQDSANINLNYLTFSSGSLSGTPTNVTSASTFNLTTLGTTDWAAWGYNGTDRDSSGGSKIGALSVAGAGSLNSFTSSFLGFTWTNGTPDTSVTGETKGYYNNAGVGDGFSFTVPASTSVQTLTVYVGGWSSGGTLTATLSDGSAATYTDSSMVNTGNSYYGYYTLTYSAGSANQTLTVTWKQNQGTGNVTIYAATLH
jgi:glycosidase